MLGIVEGDVREAQRGSSAASPLKHPLLATLSTF